MAEYGLRNYDVIKLNHIQQLNSQWAVNNQHNNKKQVALVTAPETALNYHMASKHDGLDITH
jgi:hypothetical protein